MRTYADKIKLRKLLTDNGVRGKGQLVPLIMSGRRLCLHPPNQQVGGGELRAAIT